MTLSIISFLITTLVGITSGNFVLEKEIKCTADFFSTDHIGNIYLVEKGVLTKYNSELNQVATFSRRDRGQIDFIDATDPLKLLVYYSEFGTIDFLDSYLADNSRTELSEFDIYQQTVVCRSHDNGIWTFDPVMSQIVKIDSELNIKIRSQSFNQLFNQELNPTYINESEKWLVLSDKNKGLYVFDRLGVYLKSIPVKNVESLQVFQDIIVYHDYELIHQYNILTGLDETLAMPELEAEKVKQIRLEQNLMYMLTNRSLKIFKWRI